ncbi:hypothetical protein EXE58_10390 [Nocardioides seonyuensis]|uniref:DUF559 domain-containing protein n=1 Tax=Nocardioides seonyuensis TaxID=2518371 RepID=A0A4P7IEY6_9ACTN|nr:hypothetical protein [Nocardioides seonyuensis]QBX55824.1 hypothetical protein EXE58_10390 [Nocardioides seonyuensis]
MTSRPAPRTGAERAARRAVVEALAKDQDGVVARRQVYAAGLSRGEVDANIRAGRWQAVGRHCLALTTGALGERALLRAAQLAGGPRAQLDGASSLIAAGLKGFTVDRHRVSVPRGGRVFRDSRVNVRQTRRWASDDMVEVGIPRTRNEVAAVRAALWARSDREAALLLTMTVQQGLTTAERLASQVLRIKKAPRLAFVRDVLSDLLGGVRSLGELDFARECRRRGLPEPDRQVVRRGRDGRYYLDVHWDEWGVVVEIDGIQHSWASEVVPDALRQNEVTLQHDVVLRLPVLGLRVSPDDFFDQVRRALRDRGWTAQPPAA